MHAGVIVAGGRSTRFEGGDKALATLRGTPLVRHVADRLAPAVDTVVVNCRVEQRPGIEAAMESFPRPLSIATDEVEGLGPIGGIATGLAALEGSVQYAAVVACDMPLLEPAFISYLFGVAEAEGADAVVPRDEDAWYQVLHAVYEPTPMAAACRRALEAGDRKLLAPLDHLDPVVVDPEDYRAHGTSRSFANVNTRAELEQVGSILAADGDPSQDPS